MPFSSLLLTGLCLLISFLYAGIEAGLLSLNRTRLRSRVHRGEVAAVRLDRLLAHPGRLLGTVLLVTNLADVTALVLIGDAFVRRLGVWGYPAAFAVMLPVYLLGVRLLPKLLFRRFPFRALLALAGLLELTSRAAGPFMDAARWLLRRTAFAAPPAAVRSQGDWLLAREEFKALAAEGEHTGALTPVEHRMIDNAINFSDTPARELMNPPPKPFVLPAGSGGEDGAAGPLVGDLLDAARAAQVQHLPVVTAAGRLTALVDVAALLFDRDPGRDAAAYLRRQPLVVAPGDTALRVLRRLRALRLSAAAVCAEDGGLVGIVRTKDLLGRLVRQTSSGDPGK